MVLLDHRHWISNTLNQKVMIAITNSWAFKTANLVSGNNNNNNNNNN